MVNGGGKPWLGWKVGQMALYRPLYIELGGGPTTCSRRAECAQPDPRNWVDTRVRSTLHTNLMRMGAWKISMGPGGGQRRGDVLMFHSCVCMHVNMYCT